MPFFTRAFPTADPTAIGLGLIAQAYEQPTAAVGLAPTAGTIIFASIWLPAGQAIGNLVFGVSTAASGTVPTSIVVGLADSTGKMLAQSAEQKSNAKWTSTGWKKIPLSASYTPPSSGIYRIVFLQVGSWSVTQLQLANRTIAVAAQGDLSSIPYGTGGATQTALPANASTLPTIAAASNAIWVGAAA